MFLKKLFRRDAETYRDKAEKLLAAGRLAEARSTFEDALDAIDPGDACAAVLETTLRGRIAEIGNRLAEMNIEEARHYLAKGDSAKATEHLDLAIDLAEDVTIREKAEMLRPSLPTEAPPVHHHHHGGGCSSCTGDHHQPVDSAQVSPDNLSAVDRFELLVRPLPGDLPERYLNLGEDFAAGYLAADSGDTATARAIYENLLRDGESDILLYEAALLSHRDEDSRECEALLRRALGINSANPLCNLGLVQLLAEAGRFDEAMPLLQSMVEREILAEQAMMFLGDIHAARSENEQAIDYYSRLLGGPLKRDAAERLAGLLAECGRTEEAEYVAKQYLKGCC